MLSVTEIIPSDVVEGIGAARTIGRDRWEDLKKLFNGPKRVDRAREIVVSEEFAAADSVGRFGLLWRELKAGGTAQRKRATPPSLSAWAARDKHVAATWRATSKTFSLSLSERDAREFGAYISSRLDGLYEAFRQAKAGTATGD
jgi:ParB family chromosome partitioning protein